MARLLHLSDLHLGAAGAWQLGDYKSEIIDEHHRLNRHDLLRGTLAALRERLEQDGRPVDAVVISGDVTYQGQADGLEALDSLLAGLGTTHPGLDRTVVVPGNHDVRWRTKPDSRERYELFVNHIRSRGYVTPLLEGIDITGDGQDLGTGHNPLLDLGDIVLIPVNSSNHCGTLEPLGELTESELQELQDRASEIVPLRHLLERFDELRLVDVCRVSKGQTQVLTERLAERALLGPLGLKVVVLHHHLLPVNVEEEVRPFESMINLGFFRQWLHSIDVKLVLHGHKHAPSAYLDLPGVPPMLEAGQSVRDGIVIVSSVATANEAPGPELARVVDIESPGPSVRSISVDSIPPAYPGLQLGAFPRVAAMTVTLEPVASRVRVFEGGTVDAVYHQLLAAFPEESYEVRFDVMCRVQDGSSGLRLPEAYPVPLGEDPAEWFDETVSWWQNPEPQLVAPQFNHGQRIWHAPHNIDQFDLAVRQLHRPGTSRAVVLLIDPQAGQESLYPAMCLVQLRIPAGSNRLDCVGYFRKQQMRAWWPVNVGELAHLQRRAIDALGEYVPGEIVTISALAIGGSDRPRVAVPRIDRWSQDKPEAIWDLALSTVNTGHPDRGSALDRWERMFNDWRPGDVMERDGVPVALRGLSAMADAIETCARSFPTAGSGALVRALRELSTTTHIYWRTDSGSTDDAHRHVAYQEWRLVASAAIDRVLERARAMLIGPA